MGIREFWDGKLWLISAKQWLFRLLESQTRARGSGDCNLAAAVGSGGGGYGFVPEPLEQRGQR